MVCIDFKICGCRAHRGLTETLELVKQLEASGASLIAVHARYRGTPTHRRDGPAHLDQVRAIKKVVRVPILSNGNIKSWEDVVANLELTQADGVMSAEGLLDDPCIFAGSGEVDSKKALRKVEKKLRQVQKLLERQASGASLNAEELQKVATRKQLRKERKSLSSSGEVEEGVQLRVPTDGLEKARVYLDYVSRFQPAPPLSTIIFHCRRMAKAELTEFQLLEDFKSSKSFQEMCELLSKAEAFKRSPGSFRASKEKEQRDRELRAQQAYEVECRRKYEQRMARKAARLGLPLEEVMRASAACCTSMASRAGWQRKKRHPPGCLDVREISQPGEAANEKGKARLEHCCQGLERKLTKLVTSSCISLRLKTQDHRIKRLHEPFAKGVVAIQTRCDFGTAIP
eukprot:s1809_g2.t1